MADNPIGIGSLMDGPSVAPIPHGERFQRLEQQRRDGAFNERLGRNDPDTVRDRYRAIDAALRQPVDGSIVNSDDRTAREDFEYASGVDTLERFYGALPDDVITSNIGRGMAPLNPVTPAEKQQSDEVLHRLRSDPAYQEAYRTGAYLNGENVRKSVLAANIVRISPIAK